MLIHTIRSGDNLFQLSQRYGVPVERIIKDNGITNTNYLVVGQALVIGNNQCIHSVMPGQTMESIARQYGVKTEELVSLNSQLSADAVLLPGEFITVPSCEKLGCIMVNGYAYPSAKMDILRTSLPYLTFLSIFSYQVKADGSLLEIDEIPLIQTAQEYAAESKMVITNIEEGGSFSSDLAHQILNDTAVQENLLDNCVRIMEEKGYLGLDVDFEYLYPQDREAYNAFLRRARKRMNDGGFLLSTAIAPKYTADQEGTLYEAHDYPAHGRYANQVILMTYDWGYVNGPPMAVAPINEVRRVLEYAVTEIPPKKILMGIPNYGYDWTLPYQPGTSAKVINHVEAVNLAARVGATIQYDETAQAPYFYYYDKSKQQHVVWFEDARSIYAKLMLVNEFGLGGVSYWTVNYAFPQNWVVLSSMYDVVKY